MCLTKANKINVKDGGLKVYKFLIHNFDEPEGVYHSPYYDSAWVIGKLHTKNEFDDVFDGSTNTKDRIKDLRNNDYKCIISGCSYHSYKELRSALYNGAGFHAYQSLSKLKSIPKKEVVIADLTEKSRDGIFYRAILAYEKDHRRDILSHTKGTLTEEEQEKFEKEEKHHDKEMKKRKEKEEREKKEKEKQKHQQEAE